MEVFRLRQRGTALFVFLEVAGFGDANGMKPMRGVSDHLFFGEVGCTHGHWMAWVHHRREIEQLADAP